MTMRDYEKIAAELRYNKPTDKKRAEGWAHAVFATANAMQGDNPRFDREKFYKKCGFSDQ